VRDVGYYQIRLAGEVDANEVNAMSPLQVAVEALQPGATPVSTTLMTFCTDQSGLLGLMRHLHGLGFIVLSLTRADV
jgi:hypothetical protein